MATEADGETRVENRLERNLDNEWEAFAHANRRDLEGMTTVQRGIVRFAWYRGATQGALFGVEALQDYEDRVMRRMGVVRREVIDARGER